jgi:PAS domain S-box-containing protein
MDAMMENSGSENRTSLERRYRALIEVIPDIVYRLDLRGNFTYINGCIKNLGYEPADLFGKHFSTIIHPDDVKLVSRTVVVEKLKGLKTGDEGAPKLFDERRSGNRMTKWLEVRLIPKGWTPEGNGSSCIFGALNSVGEVSATGVYTTSEKPKNRKFLATVGIIRDITERKRREEERKKLEQQYLKAQRFEAIGLLAGGLAHDFKNLLTIALGYVEIGLDQCKTNDILTSYLNKSLTALHRCKNLTQQLLNFSRAGVPKKNLLEFGRILKNAVNIAIGESGIKPTFVIDRDLWPLEVDESQIVQVIDNIVINARHAMPSGGKLDVQAHNHHVKHGDNSALQSGRYIKVAVTDYGIGIPKENLSKIFEPFFTTKQDGSGLGLATSYFIIQNHHGAIEIASEQGVGTTLTFYLPATADVPKNQL